MNRPASPRRVAIIAPIAVRNDGISNDSRRLYHMLREGGFPHVDFFTSCNEFPDLPAQLVGNVGQLLRAPAFRAADLLIYQFGIYNPLIDAMLLGNGHARQAVVFHNITPPDVLPASARPLIERSFRQLHNLKKADQLWAVSPLNASVLIEHGFDAQKIHVLPVPVPRPALGDLAAKTGALEIVFVGRIVPAKGLSDAVAAFAALRAAGVDARLTAIGNLALSDAAYLEACKDKAAALGVTEHIVFVGTADDATLEDAYQKAQVLLLPSYHEGFCIPIVEGLRAGCVPVSYRAGNIPNVANGLGCLVEPGDTAGLGAALVRLAQALRTRSPLPLDRGATTIEAFDRDAKTYVEQFTLTAITERMLDQVRAVLAL